jgi:restriction system protein
MSLLEQRFSWLFNHRLQAQPRLQRRPVSKSGLVLMGGVTAVFLTWLLYRWILQPLWILKLPTFMGELVQLIEVAGALTMVLLWVVLWWRQRPFIQQTQLVTISLDELYEMDPTAFEKYVAQLFRQRGYRVKHRGRTGDMGVDLELANGNGRRAIVQCKRYRNTVGPEVIRELYGTLIHEKVAHGFLVTTGEISQAAREWANGKPLTLIDGEMLVQLVSAVEMTR